MTIQQAGLIPTFTQADRLRKAREVAHLDQVDLADEIGISRQTVSNYETGSSHPRKIVLKAWALASGVPLEWLMDGTRPPTPDSGQWAPRESNPQPADYKYAASRPLLHLVLIAA
ncbi:MAG TPA: helix-turn-helix transcriptional regulator [Chloroflexota bacterium]|nr:helix-turn-helix transcriptional regulator [Chloroflexota bacterium]